MVKTPAYLQPGDTIGIVCPGGFMAPEKAQTCIQVLQDWGYTLKIGRTLGVLSDNYFSGTDQQRLEDFQQMLDDGQVKAIFCARGGYGISRIIDQLKFSDFKKNPKWIIGFSDVTLLHAHIYRRYKTASLHAPMASAFNDGGYEDEYVQSLRQVLAGEKIRYQCATHALNRRGEAVGELVGGNLSLLVHAIGTPSDLKTKGRILVLEDVGEYIYQVDRMMRQLLRGGKLDYLAGLIVGGFTDIRDTERPFGRAVYDLIHDIIRPFDYPVCFGFPVSHGKENYALKLGTGYKLKVGRNKVMLEE